MNKKKEKKIEGKMKKREKKEKQEKREEIYSPLFCLVSVMPFFRQV
jgi:hypothetical protein